MGGQAYNTGEKNTPFSIFLIVLSYANIMGI